MSFASRQTILVIQDSPELSSMIISTIERYGFTTHYVDNTEESLNYLKTRQPILIIMDLGLPGLSCWDVVRYAREQYEDIPVIATTGYGENTKRDTSPLEHIDCYLVKPFTRQRFSEALSDVLGLQLA